MTVSTMALPVIGADAPAPAERSSASVAPNGPAKPRNARRATTVALVGLAAAAAAAWVYVPSLYSVATDDAYVQADIVSVVPKVSAYVTALHVEDNKPFEAGALLVELDPRDYQVALDSARADLRAAEAAKANVQAQVEEQGRVIAANQAAVDGDTAALTFAGKQLTRYRELAGTGFGTGQRLEQAQSDSGVQQAALEKDRANLEASKARTAVLQSQVQQAEAMIARQQAAVAQATLNLSYTKIRAEAAGSVANRIVQVGNFVQSGQTLFSAVPAGVFVVANFKETQLGRMRAGQAVTIRVDAFPGRALKAYIDSFQRGTGSTFALLPPENATGNFVKVVQRVPVKIKFDEAPDALRQVSPGMSVEVTVAVAEKPWWLAFF